jgi:hypothetical protein
MKKSRSVSPLVFCLAIVATAAHAAPLTRDLGQGLVYHRVATLPADLPVLAGARQQPCVLDLRYARGDAAAGTALDAWLKFNAASRAPVFLLLNTDTAPAVLAPLAARLPAPGLIVIGPASSALKPDLALKLAPAAERRAYAALAAGATVESLVNDSTEKVRHDEARLAQDHRGQADPAALARTPDDSLDDLLAEPPAAEKSAPPATPPPLIDLALQRAVHLHRSLQALKKL